MDGEITVVDATHIQRFLAEMTTFDDAQKKAADADRNGLVDILDATTIQRFLAELIPAL